MYVGGAILLLVWPVVRLWFGGDRWQKIAFPSAALGMFLMFLGGFAHGLFAGEIGSPLTRRPCYRQETPKSFYFCMLVIAVAAALSLAVFLESAKELLAGRQDLW
jgi:hypothetical protein